MARGVLLLGSLTRRRPVKQGHFQSCDLLQRLAGDALQIAIEAGHRLDDPVNPLVRSGTPLPAELSNYGVPRQLHTAGNRIQSLSHILSRAGWLFPSPMDLAPRSWREEKSR
jgi:hypothetical protein